MNITQESTGELTATIKIELIPEDYREQVNKTLKDFQKKSTLRGFRPGKIPMGLIKKMYGKGAVAEEINKVVSESLNNYIKEEDLDILGYPIGSKEKNKEIDFENDENFEFYFDIGLTPEIDLELSDKIKADYYDIKVGDEKIENYLEDIRKRYGTPVSAEIVEKGNVIKGDIVQLNDEGNMLDGGITNSTSLHLDFIKDDKVKKEFIGKKKEDKIRFNPLKATDNVTETASMLGIEKEEAENLDSDFEFTITEILRIEPAKIDIELFRKVYPKDNIEDEKQFRERLREEANKYYQRESDNFFIHTAIGSFFNDTKINLPEDFMKRWLIESNEKLTEETVEKDYDHYAKTLKQQLIINKISKDNNIKVEEKDIRDHLKKSLAAHYMIDSEDEENLKNLEPIIDSVFKNKDEVNKIYDELFDNQLKSLLKSKLKLNKKEVSYDDFIKIVNEYHKKQDNEHK